MVEDSVAARPSSVEGLGLFARSVFSPRQVIHRINVLREITPEAPLRPELGERADHCDYPDGRILLIGPPDCFVNHSCDPNAWVRYDRDGPCLVARRTIEMDAEVTCDYAINVTGGSAWPCRCGAARCRGRVEGDFFRLPFAVQVEYGPYLASWFVRRHQGRLRALGLAC